MKRHLPSALTTLRLLHGLVASFCAFAGTSRWVYLPILVVGTLSDILDGIIARRLGVATVGASGKEELDSAGIFVKLVT